MFRLHQSVYGRDYLSDDNRELLARFQERDGGVQYFGDHVDDLPPLGRLLGPIDADARRTYKAMQDTDGYVQSMLQAVQAKGPTSAQVRRLDRDPVGTSLHASMVRQGNDQVTVRDRRVPKVTESYSCNRRKY